MASLSHSLIVEYLSCFQAVVIKTAAVDISLTVLCQLSRGLYVAHQLQKNIVLGWDSVLLSHSGGEQERNEFCIEGSIMLCNRRA